MCKGERRRILGKAGDSEGMSAPSPAGPVHTGPQRAALQASELAGEEGAI